MEFGCSFVTWGMLSPKECLVLPNDNIMLPKDRICHQMIASAFVAWPSFCNIHIFYLYDYRHHQMTFWQGGMQDYEGFFFFFFFFFFFLSYDTELVLHLFIVLAQYLDFGCFSIRKVNATFFVIKLGPWNYGYYRYCYRTSTQQKNVVIAQGIAEICATLV